MDERIAKIGEIVIYQVHPNDAPEVRHNHADELPAIVVACWSDHCVNLKVFTDGPTDAWVTRVEMGDEPGKWYRPSDE